jgi:hypothetical protein
MSESRPGFGAWISIDKELSRRFKYRVAPASFIVAKRNKRDNQFHEDHFCFPFHGRSVLNCHENLGHFNGTPQFIFERKWRSS